MENLSKLQYLDVLIFAFGWLVALALNRVFNKKKKVNSRTKSVSVRNVKPPRPKLEVVGEISQYNASPILFQDDNKEDKPISNRSEKGKYEKMYKDIEVGKCVYFDNPIKVEGFRLMVKRVGGRIKTENIIRHGKNVIKVTKIK